MDALEELTSYLTGGSRSIAISERDIALNSQSPDNRIFLLKMAEGSLAAGGRGGGFGERRVVKVLLFEQKSGAWSKTFETTDESKAGEYEIPYYVSRLPFILQDGTESVGYGVVEADLVHQMMAKSGVPSSA